jgi:hypothetical protein
MLAVAALQSSACGLRSANPAAPHLTRGGGDPRAAPSFPGAHIAVRRLEKCPGSNDVERRLEQAGLRVSVVQAGDSLWSDSPNPDAGEETRSARALIGQLVARHTSAILRAVKPSATDSGYEAPEAATAGFTDLDLLTREWLADDVELYRLVTRDLAPPVFWGIAARVVMETMDGRRTSVASCPQLPDYAAATFVEAFVLIQDRRAPDRLSRLSTQFAEFQFLAKGEGTVASARLTEERAKAASFALDLPWQPGDRYAALATTIECEPDELDTRLVEEEPFNVVRSVTSSRALVLLRDVEPKTIDGPGSVRLYVQPREVDTPCFRSLATFRLDESPEYDCSDVPDAPKIAAHDHRYEVSEEDFSALVGLAHSTRNQQIAEQLGGAASKIGRVLTLHTMVCKR